MRHCFEEDIVCGGFDTLMGNSMTNLWLLREFLVTLAVDDYRFLLSGGCLGRYQIAQETMRTMLSKIHLSDKTIFGGDTLIDTSKRLIAIGVVRMA